MKAKETPPANQAAIPAAGTPVPATTLADYRAMTIDQLRPHYKRACAMFRDISNQVDAIRSVLHAKQEIATEEARLAEVKGKHASNAGTGGGL